MFHVQHLLISVGRLTVIWGDRSTSSRRCWSATRNGSTSVWRWARNSLLRRWALKAHGHYCWSWIFMASTLISSCLGQAGEDGVQGQEHAGPPASGPLHHRTAWSFLHRAVDGWIRLPEPHQVSARMKPELGFMVALSTSLIGLDGSVILQAAGASQLTEGGYREAEEAAGEEEATILGSNASTQPGTEQAKEQEQQPGEWSVRRHFISSVYISLWQLIPFHIRFSQWHSDLFGQ